MIKTGSCKGTLLTVRNVQDVRTLVKFNHLIDKNVLEMKLFLCVLSLGLTSDTSDDKCADKDSNNEYLHCLQVLERDYWVSSLT